MLPVQIATLILLLPLASAVVIALSLRKQGALALLFTGLALTFGPGPLSVPAPVVGPALGASLKLYGYQLFTTYLLPVQIVGFMLLISMLGVIVLSKKLHTPEDVS